MLCVCLICLKEVLHIIKSEVYASGVQTFVEHWGGKFAILPQFFSIFNIGGDEPRPQFCKLSKEQKKGIHQKWSTFFPEFR